MKSQVVFAAAVALGSGAALAQPSHQPYGAGVDGPAVRAALETRWPTDAALRRGMEEIRAAVAATQVAMRAGSLSPDAFVALGDSVEERIGRIAAESRLPPEAEARMHVVLARLFNAADALRHGGEGALHTDRLQKLVEDYALAFDHPGWSPPRAGAISLHEATRLVAAELPGRVMAARADVRQGEPLHYHVDVRTAEGSVARLNVDARSRLVTWREPAPIKP